MQRLMKLIPSVFVLILLDSCATYSLQETPKAFIPDDITSEVSIRERVMDLSKEKISEVKDKLSEDGKNLLKALLYNYYDSYYGLKICNAKLDVIRSYMQQYNKIANS